MLGLDEPHQPFEPDICQSLVGNWPLEKEWSSLRADEWLEKVQSLLEKEVIPCQSTSATD